MKEFRILKVLDLFRGLFEKFGVDYRGLRTILQIKLLMDQRRVPTIFNQSSANKKAKTDKEENNFIKSLWQYGLFGLVMIPFVIWGDHYISQMSLVFSIIMFMVMSSMIADFSTVLLDIRDKHILHTKPLSVQTINLAKVIHVCVYMFFLSFAICAAPLVAGLWKHGVAFFALFAGGIILTDLFLLVFTAFVYMAILYFFDGEKLKDLINYIQIVLSLVIMLAYQMAGRSIEIINLQLVFVPKWWQFLVPPVWFGATFEWLLAGNSLLFYHGLSLMAVVVPLAAMVLYIKLIPVFERNVQKLSQTSTGGGKQRSRWIQLLSRVVCRKREERIFFRFASRMMSNEREFKLKVYPSIGYSLIIPFLILSNEFRSSTWEEIQMSHWYLSIYLCLGIIPTVVMMVRYSGTYKGAWIYQTTPVQDRNLVYSGTLKASVTQLFLPLFAISSIVFISIFGIKIIPDVLAVLASSCLYTITCFLSLKKRLPFSEPFKSYQQDEGLKIIFLLLLMGIFGLVHYFATQIQFGIYFYLLVLLVINQFVWKKAFPTRKESE